jgi:methyltransferase
MSGPLAVAGMTVVAVLLMMLAESRRSRRNEAALRVAGACEPDDDVIGAMTIAYPGSFVAMAIEGALFGPEPGPTTIAGLILLAAAKGLKYWAIGSLGERWTFRVLVPPAAPLVTTGPYAYLRHPNYVAVIGELVAMAVLVGARVTGPLMTVVFALLIRRRIKVEERALRHPPCS